MSNLWVAAVAADHETMYHQSPARNRRSIQESGLKTDFDNGDGYTEAGIYMSPKPGDSQYEDVWKVNTKGLHLLPDSPGQMSEFQPEGGSWYHPHDVEPSRVTLHRPATKHWSDG